MRFAILFILFSSIILSSCNSNSDNSKGRVNTYDLDNINIGEVKLYADKNSKFLLEQLGAVYSAHFPKASLKATYTEDSDVMNAIYADSTRLIVLMRECTKAELNKIQRLYQTKPLQYIFGYDAIVFVRDISSNEILLDSNQINNLLANGTVDFVGTIGHSGLFTQLLNQKGITTGMRHLNTVQTIDELQKFLKLHPNKIGILPYSLVSDQYNPISKDIATRFKWLRIKESNSSDTILPSQSTIYTKEWPFVIPYTILYCNLPSEKGEGFVKFIHTRQASKLILKAGLIPFNMPERSIKLEEQSFNL